MGDDDAWSRWKRLAADQSADPMEVLRAAATFARYFNAVQGQAVVAARSTGHTWDEIAEAVGRTRQAVWQRWAKDGSDQSAPVRRAISRSRRFLAPPPPAW